jgi:small subunit ribosomal protein S19
MAKKEFTFRGKTLDELKKMDIKELSPLLTARARRTLSRDMNEQKKALLKHLEKENNVKTHCRTMIVLPNMVAKTILIHNGKTFEPVLIQPEMIGHYLGEFAMTRKKVSHSAPGIGATKSSANISVK